jgi:hypothetical protein
VKALCKGGANANAKRNVRSLPRCFFSLLQLAQWHIVLQQKTKPELQRTVKWG